MKLTGKELAQVDVLMGEIAKIQDLIAGEQDSGVAEELTQERMSLIARVNGIYGTDHIIEGSRITTINNDLNGF